MSDATGDDTKPAGQGNQTAAQLSDALKAVTAELEKAQAQNKKLMDDNFKLREDRRNNRERISELESQAPAEGALVLSKTDAEEYQQLRTFGSSKDIAEKLDKLARQTKEMTITRHAQLAGFNPKVLGALIGTVIPAEAEFTVKEESVDGQPSQTSHIKVNGKSIPLVEYAEAEFAHFLPSLRAVNSPTAGNKEWPAQASNRPNPPRELTAEQVMEQKRRQFNYRNI